MKKESFFSSRIRPVYVGLSRLLLWDGAPVVDKTEKQRRFIEARDTMEKLKNYELEDFFRDECVTASRSGMVKLDRAYPGTAILNPLLLEDSLVLLLTLPPGMIKVDVPLEEGGGASFTFGKAVQGAASGSVRQPFPLLLKGPLPSAHRPH